MAAQHSEFRRAAMSVVSQDSNDEELIAAISGGSDWGLELLYQRYGRYAYTLAYRILHENVAAEDVVQEAFLAIWRKAGSYQREQGSVLSWLQAVVHHRAIDKVRAAAHRDYQWTTLQPDNGQELLGAHPDVWEEAWRREQRLLIQEVLRQLPHEQHLVIEMGYFAGYTHSEIAERLGLPLGTVKGRMRLGLQKMRHLLLERGLSTPW